jgi:hypothetical protein
LPCLALSSLVLPLALSCFIFTFFLALRRVLSCLVFFCCVVLMCRCVGGREGGSMRPKQRSAHRSWSSLQVKVVTVIIRVMVMVRVRKKEDEEKKTL